MIENGEIEPIEVAALDPNEAPQDVTPGEYLFGDQDFPIDEEIKTLDETRPMRTPSFNLGDFSILVLGKKREWMKYRMRSKRDIHVRYPNGKRFPFKELAEGRTSFNGAPQVRLTIPDAERLAHLLYQNGQLDGEELVRAVNVLTAIALAQGIQPRDGSPRRKILKR